MKKVTDADFIIMFKHGRLIRVHKQVLLWRKRMKKKKLKESKKED